MAKRKPYDMSSPGTKALIDEIVHGTFVREGTFLAFPTCFPGSSAPIRADESRITALDATADGAVYGGTSGRAVHLFVGMFHGVTGAVIDLGRVEGATHCAAVCCGRERFVAGVNGEDGGRMIARGLQPLPFDLIQEWGFERRPFDELGRVGKGERIVHVAADPARERLVGISERHLFTVDLGGEGGIETVAEIEGRGQVCADAEGVFVGMDLEEALWRFDPKEGSLERNAVPLPPGQWKGAAPRWARAPSGDVLYTSDAEGRLFAFRSSGSWTDCGQVPLSPVGPMGVTFDGRLFGFCGEGISRLFCWDPGRGEVQDLGVAASVFERRRYGYSFGDAVVGRDGEIVFGEDDDLGHLWLYFPRIEPR